MTEKTITYIVLEREGKSILLICDIQPYGKIPDLSFIKDVEVYPKQDESPLKERSSKEKAKS